MFFTVLPPSIHGDTLSLIFKFVHYLINHCCNTFQLQSTSYCHLHSKYPTYKQSTKKLMKIFRWVHRKFYQKDGLFDRNVKKDDQLMINNHDEIMEDTQLLLQDATFAHMFDGWKGGILAKGTLGFDPLIEDHQSGLDNIEDEECEITVNDLLNPLMYANGHEQCHKALKANVINDENKTSDQSNKLDSKKQSIKKERITLADLFSADSSDNKENSPVGDSQSSLFITKKASNGLNFAKKLIPLVREDSRPILKLQQLMTRVLKRKVHPDMRSKNIHKNSQVTMPGAHHLRIQGLPALQLVQV